MSESCKSPKDGPRSGRSSKLVVLGAPNAASATPTASAESPSIHEIHDDYWRSPESKAQTKPSRGEFPGGLPSPAEIAAPPPGVETTRRDFLSLMGFGVAAGAAVAAGCRAPEQKAIPLAVASEELVPGVANHYATTCGGCASACALVVKQRDGRPIKVEGNDESPVFGGATCATGQATVLSLYDHERLRGPLWNGEASAWHTVDERIGEALAEAKAAGGDAGGSIALLTSTIHSPSLLALIERMKQVYPGFRHVMYDAVSSSALRKAGQIAFGKALIPHYALDRAKVIVGLDADFLGTWLSPVELARQYARGRRPGGGAERHVQFETGMSVTGSNADQRVPVLPSQLPRVAAALLAKVAALAGHAVAAEDRETGLVDGVDAKLLDEVAAALWRHRGASLVLSGGNDLATDRAALALNALLGNLGATLDVARPSLQRQGDDEAMAQLVTAMGRGEIHTLILHEVNPAYDYADPKAFTEGLAKVRCSISTADRKDETSSRCTAVCPDHHFLESWGDAEPIAGQLSLTQPVVAPMFETRAFAESLLGWLGEPGSHYRYLREFWMTVIAPRQREIGDAAKFWNLTLERGVLSPGSDSGSGSGSGSGSVSAASYLDDWALALRALTEQCRSDGSTASSDGARFELALFESVPLRDGRHANNPWLLELPDPISKVTWGNTAMMAPATARRLGLQTGDVVKLAAPSGAAVEVPVFLQPGQHPAAISLALGYGRALVGKAGQGVGVNGFGFAPLVSGAAGGGTQRQRQRALDVTLTATGRREELATTQDHFSMEGRPIGLEVNAGELRGEKAKHVQHPTLWPERPHAERSWGMTIDLSSCTGCSACVIACQSENNVPVIGKDQVQRQRHMHWIRIDRYYRGSEESPHSVHQPMMCQHCGHAPCETVCPVLATTTSSEGLNQQVYNRCIGTRYCANNCPYKVRRFNWFNYAESPRFDSTMTNPIARLVLNPDVTVRTRGVMEKCSLCVQRIHAAKNDAVKKGEALRDGAIETACQQVCPTDAIVFGDLLDERSRVAEQMNDERTYRVLDELGTRPNVAYLKKVRHGQA